MSSYNKYRNRNKYKSKGNGNVTFNKYRYNKNKNNLKPYVIDEYDRKIRWYFKLKKTKDDNAIFDDNRNSEISNSVNIIKKSNSLLDCVSTTNFNGKLLVQKQYNTDKYQFALFENFLDFGKYIRNIPENERCFFETIMSDIKRKPYFDIDIDLNETNPNFNPNITPMLIQDNLINSILLVFEEKGCELDLSKNFLIYYSHGPKKWSCHVIIDGYCNVDHDESKEVYNKVIANVNDEYVKYIDRSVYSSLQQFRIVGCQKSNSGRIKTFQEQWNFEGREINYEFPVVMKRNDENYKNMIILSTSLITNVINCEEMPAFLERDNEGILLSKKKKFFGDTANLNSKIIRLALELIGRNIGIPLHDRSFPFRFKEVDGALIMLKRVRRSFCSACDRIHQNENPFMFIFGEDNKVYFNCRRCNVNQYMGNLGIKTSNTNDIYSEIKNENNQNYEGDDYFDIDEINKFLPSYTESSYLQDLKIQPQVQVESITQTSQSIPTLIQSLNLQTSTPTQSQQPIQLQQPIPTPTQLPTQLQPQTQSQLPTPTPIPTLIQPMFDFFQETEVNTTPILQPLKPKKFIISTDEFDNLKRLASSNLGVKKVNTPTELKKISNCTKNRILSEAGSSMVW